MDNNYIFIEHTNELNDIITKKFHSMQRIKVKSFDVSGSYIVFGASSGGIYVLKHNPCEFVKIIPSKEGSADIIAISNNEKYLSVATSKGLIIIFENFTDSNVEYQIFSEHRGSVISAMKWHSNVLYTGDESGKISIATVSAALTKTIFQVPSESVMKLDSSIVQIDTYGNYLLVSTKTRTCVCDTDKEFYIQIGKKMRNGDFGACFCKTSEILETSESNFPSTEGCKIYCARPGLRLWEAGLDAKVIMTYQFKESLEAKSTDLLVIGNDKDDTLQEHKKLECDKISEDCRFQKIFSLCGRFILTYYARGLYVFDLSTNKLMFWLNFLDEVNDIAILNRTIYVWLNNLELRIFSLVKLENLILQTLYNEQYIMCAEICSKYCDKLLGMLLYIKDLYLISVLKKKLINKDLINQLKPIFETIDNINRDIFNSNKNNKVRIEEKETTGNVEEGGNKSLKVLLRQYIINKTYKNIKVPEAHEVLNKLSVEDLLVLLNDFGEYVLKEMSEDTKEWCQGIYLEKISKKGVVLKELSEPCLDYLTSAVIDVNKSVKYSCPCGYPLPLCHKFQPKFYEIALNILEERRDMNRIFKEIPYMCRYKIKSEIYGINISLLVQFNDQNLTKEYSKHLEYDKWYDILGYFIKLGRGVCLNCDAKINIESLITWTAIGRIVLQSLGARNTIRILKRFEKKIPQGALEPAFYQACIVTQLFKRDNGDLKTNARTSAGFLDGLQGDTYNEFQTCLEKYFNKKYTHQGNFHSSTLLWLDSNRKCSLCKLPLKNDLLDCENAKYCDHTFHSFCLRNNNGICNLCSDY